MEELFIRVEVDKLENVVDEVNCTDTNKITTIES